MMEGVALVYGFGPDQLDALDLDDLDWWAANATARIKQGLFRR